MKTSTTEHGLEASTKLIPLTSEWAELGQKRLELIFEDKTINWHGTNYSMQSNLSPVPVLGKETAEYSALEVKKAQLENYLIIAQPKDIAGLLYRLNAHYPQINMSDALMKERADSYLEILSEYPLKVIIEVCRDVILDKEIRFYPTVAELNDRAKTKLFSARWKLRKILKLLEFVK
jgi:hypothetical protein